MAKKTQTVEEYIGARSDPVRIILEDLRDFVSSTWPEATEGMKWGAPVYMGKDGIPLIYLYGGKDHANLGFVRGAELQDPNNLLEGKGKAGRHIKVYPGDEMPKKEMAAFIRECAELAESG